jgi:hypothetical protein
MRGLRNQPGDRALHFVRLWNGSGTEHLPQPVREFPFAGLEGDRNWRFDVAWPAEKIAVELEGIARGKRSRHTERRGYQADCEKYNEAALDGWTLLRFTSEDLDKRPGKVIDLVVLAIQLRGA